MADLILPVRRKWFEQIRDGIKTEEYRQETTYWCRRLKGKTFDRVVIQLGYPPKHDQDRRLIFPWKGYTMKVIESEEFENIPQRVFAIKLEKSS